MCQVLNVYERMPMYVCVRAGVGLDGYGGLVLMRVARQNGADVSE